MNSSLEKPTSPEIVPTRTENPTSTENQEHQMLNPELILVDLKKRAETATSKEERERFRWLAEQLMRSFELKSEKMVDGTKGELAKLNSSISPSQQKLLQDAKAALESGAGKIASTGQEVVSATKEMWGKAVEAIKSGDIKEATKLMEGVKESINAAGQKVMEYSGVKALEKVLEPLKTGGVMGIFTVLSNIWKFLMGGMKWSEIVGEAGAGVWEKGKGVKRKAENGIDAATESIIAPAKTAFEEYRKAKESGNEKRISDARANFWKTIAPLITNSNLTPDEKSWLNTTIKEVTTMDIEEIRKDGFKKAKTYVEKTFFNGAELSRDRYDRFVKVLEEHKFSDELVREKLLKIRENKELSIDDIAQVTEKYVFGSGILVMKLALNGVIPLHKIAVSAVQTTAEQGIDATKKYIALTLDWVHISPASIGMDELQKIADECKDSPQQRWLYLYMLQKPAGIAAALAGAMAGWAMSLAVGFSTYTEVDSLTKMAPDFFKWHVDRNFSGLIENFERLEKSLGTEASVNGTYGSKLRELEQVTQTVRKNYEMLADLEIKCKTLSAEDAKALRNSVSYTIQKSTDNNVLTTLRNGILKMGWGAEGRMVEQLDHLKRILDTQALLAVRDAKVVEYYRALRDVTKVATISRVQDTTMLMVKEWQSIADLKPALLKLWSVGVKHFFNGIPLVGLAVGTTDIMNDDNKKSELTEWGSIVAWALSMPWAGWVLFRDSTVAIKDGGVTLSNTGTWAIGATLLVASGAYVIKNVTKPLEVMKFVSWYTTLKQAGNTITAIGRWVVIGQKVVPKLLPTISEAVQMSKWKRATAAILIAWTLGIYLGRKTFMDTPYESAVAEGYIDKNTNEFTKKWASQLMAIDKKGRTEIIDAITYAQIQSLWIENIFTDYKDGMYRLITNNAESAKKIQEAVNPLVDNFAKHGLGGFEVVLEESKKEKS